MIRFKLADDWGFFWSLMYANDIWVNLDSKINETYWNFISQLYISSDHYINEYSIDNLLKYMADLTKEILKKKGVCCEQHCPKDFSPFKGNTYKLNTFINPIIIACKNIIVGWSHDELPVIKDASFLFHALLWNENPCYLLSILNVIDELVFYETSIADEDGILYSN